MIEDLNAKTLFKASGWLFAAFVVLWACQKIFFACISPVEDPYPYNLAESVLDFICVSLFVLSAIGYMLTINILIKKHIEDE